MWKPQRSAEELRLKEWDEEENYYIVKFWRWYIK